MKRCVFCSVLFIFLLSLSPAIGSTNATNATILSDTSNYPFILSQGVICEKIDGGKPKFVSVVFPVDIKNLYCYTSFNSIKQETVIYHVWYFRDKLVAKIKLKLRPPVWATFSRIYLRDTDKGPWRVEILDEEGNIITILRFSVVQ